MSRPKRKPITFRMFCDCGPQMTMHEVWGRRVWRRLYTRVQYAKPQCCNRCTECHRMWPTFQYRKPWAPAQQEAKNP